MRISDWSSDVCSSDRSKRPRYALLVLKLIAQEAGSHDSVGPYVGSGKGRVPVRDWLCQALAPRAQRDCRRRAMIDAVRADLISRAGMVDPEIGRAPCGGRGGQYV